jgi:uncharacterized membrane protein
VASIWFSAQVSCAIAGTLWSMTDVDPAEAVLAPLGWLFFARGVLGLADDEARAYATLRQVEDENRVVLRRAEAHRREHEASGE